MKPIVKPWLPLLGLLALIAGCAKNENPVAPPVIPPLSSLVVSPHADTLAVDASAQFTAVAVDTAGHPYTGRLDWSSSDPGVFTVTSTGLVRGVGEGAAILVVSGGGQLDSARVLVLPAASGWLMQTSNASETLNGVFFDPAGRLGWVVGNGGLILSTDDAGATWTRQTPTTFNLRGVWFTSALEGWAVGDAGTVMHTLNGGTTWSRITSPATSENLMHVHFATPSLGWVSGANGLVLATSDGGDTWQKSYLMQLSRPTFTSIMFAGPEDGWAVGTTGAIVGTHDGGATWFVAEFVTGQTLRALWRSSVDHAVAVGAAGVAPRTVVTPDSVAWVLGNAGSSYELEGVCFPTDSTGYAVGWNGSGAVLRSDDGGESWRAQTASAQFRLRAVFFVDERRGWAVGESGTIRHTSSGGE